MIVDKQIQLEIGCYNVKFNNFLTVLLLNSVKKFLQNSNNVDLWYCNLNQFFNLVFGDVPWSFIDHD